MLRIAWHLATANSETGARCIRRRNCASKPALLAVASLLLGGCVAIPVPVNPETLVGTSVTPEDLDDIVAGNTTKDQLINMLGAPLLWLPRQRTAVYGTVRIEKTGLLVVDSGGGSATWRTTERAALFVLFDDNDIISHWGQGEVHRKDSWLGAALNWADSISLELPRPGESFVQEMPDADECLVYFYRPRDRQYYFPGFAPAKRIPFNVNRFVDVVADAALIGQLRWRSYLVARLPPGEHQFQISPYAESDSAMTLPRSISLGLEPGTVRFVDIQVESGKGYAAPLIVERSREEAMPELEKLREAW